MTNKSQFLIYCIQKYSQIKKMQGADVVDLFEKYNLQDYILEFSELIQTQGDLAIIAELDEFIRVRQDNH
ncbi:MAG: DUF3791 domain-containing protein [Proteobacteria bacterium]|nr:DUF3791 domain-containing protein [Pseudomonadota bacterium]